jgi:branched-subunit amino acid transport protein
VTPSSDWLIWAVIGIGAVATFALRASFIFLLVRAEGGMTRLEPVLNYLPVAVLAALVAPSFFFNDGSAVIASGSENFLAGVGAFVVAWVSENMLATIIVGMAIFWSVRFFL